MNKVFLTGRLTRDVEIRSSNNDRAIARTGIAVERPTKKREVDFFNLVAFDKTAEFLGKYFSKNSRLMIDGHLHYSSYEDKAGNKRNSVDVIVDNIEFTESKSENKNQSTPDSKSGKDNLEFDPDDIAF